MIGAIVPHQVYLSFSAVAYGKIAVEPARESSNQERFVYRKVNLAISERSAFHAGSQLSLVTLRLGDLQSKSASSFATKFAFLNSGSILLVRVPISNIGPILGTGKLEHIHTAADAIQLKLTREQWFAVWTASTGNDVP